MRALGRALGALGAAALCGACAGAPRATAPPGAAPSPAGLEAATAPPAAAGRTFDALATRFTARAVAAERAGDLHGALEAWRVVAALRPSSEEAGRRVADLAGRTRREAESRYQAGLARLAEGADDAARREFLLALTADPDHAAALEALRERLDPDVGRHVVVAGDTFPSLAQRYLGDPALGPVVARVNGLSPATPPAPGTVLVVPLAAGMRAAPAAAISPEDDEAYRTGAGGPAAAPAKPPEPAVPEPAPAKPAPDPAVEKLALAERLLAARRFEEAAAAADELVKAGAGGRRAKETAAAAWFGAGDRAVAEDRFDAAVAAYRRADPALRDVAAAVAAAERRRRERADELYNEGVRLFIDQKLDGAIAAWERTLVFNPQHPKAPKDLEKARALKRRLEELR